MKFSTLKIPGGDAVWQLDLHRSWYADTGLYPFLIGDDEELQRVSNLAATLLNSPYWYFWWD